MMAKTSISLADIAKVESDLWNTVRALEAIERSAEAIALAGSGEINALAEGIAGIAAVTVHHVRCQQIALGGAE